MAGAAASLALVPAAHAADLRATPSDLPAVFASAGAGDRILLAAGNYGTFRGGSKSGTVTLTPAGGAEPTMSLSFSGARNIALEGLRIPGASLTGSTRDIVIRNSTFTGTTTIDGLANANVLLSGNTHNGINAGGQWSSPARIHLSYSGSTHSGVTIRDSELAGGDSDGVQSGVGVNVINNVFSDILEEGSNHTDAIQLLGAPGSVIRGNYFRNVATGIVAYDRVERAVIEDNVLDVPQRPWGIELYSDDGSIVQHNTLKRGSCAWNLPCGMIDLNRKAADPAGRGTVVRDNIAADVVLSNGSTAAQRSNNLLARAPLPGNLLGAPVFAGGANPTSYAGFRLVEGSPGKRAASDGTDVGARIGTGPAPNPLPPPPPAPTPEPEPVRARWTVPADVVVGRAVTLDGSASGGDRPLSCTWSFEDEEGDIVWERLTGCTLSKVFRYAGTKYVRLIVRDSSGDTSSSLQSFTVRSDD